MRPCSLLQTPTDSRWPPANPQASASASGQVCPHAWAAGRAWPAAPAQAPGPLQRLHAALLQPSPTAEARAEAAAWLHTQLASPDLPACELPDTPDALPAWMAAHTAGVARAFAQYLRERREGAPRRYFGTCAQALHFLRCAAPTKLVDGAWLYGVLAASATNLRLAPLVGTYLDELGHGWPGRNHVALYRRLLADHELDTDDLDDEHYRQGLVQLTLGWNAEAFLPEIVGFNLGYEQLPLHLLITAHELQELGIDPTYFRLHVTVDNTHTGHARQACAAVQQLLPRHADAQAFWQRVRNGSRLADLGVATPAAQPPLDLRAEVVRILQRKGPAGCGLHASARAIGGQTINEWLAEPARMAELLDALVAEGWVRPGQPVQASRFWHLIDGDQAAMWGVFSGYERQVLRDWISQPQECGTRCAGRSRAQRARPVPPPGAPELDPDLAAFRTRIARLDPAERNAALIAAMGPAEHWTPVGLYATRLWSHAAPLHG